MAAMSSCASSRPCRAPQSDAERTQAKAVVARSVDEAEAEAVYGALKSRYKTQIDEARVARTTDSSAPPPQ